MKSFDYFEHLDFKYHDSFLHLKLLHLSVSQNNSLSVVQLYDRLTACFSILFILFYSVNF